MRVIAVQLQDVHPPKEVSDAFKDVASAREDKSRIINEAEAYRNALLPQARGEAAAILNRAEAYRVARLQQAEGESRRFDALRQEYEKAPDVTRQRLYYETMEEILDASKDKTLLDSGVSGKVLPHMPLPGTPAPGVLPSEKK